VDQIDIKNMINTLADYIPQASQWEQGFFESVKTQFEKRHTLSEKQIETVQKIADKFSPEAIKERESWYSSWDEEKAETLRLCADYYMGTGYFRDVVDRVKTDKDFIPTPKLYKSMCQNKYADKVMTAYRAEPKFPVGSLATLRATKSRSVGYMVSNRDWVNDNEINVLILTTDEPIVSAAAGAKRYKCMIVGGTDTFFCEERDLKKMKRKKK
jgi:enoyl-CoA hydratase/carnithine racemase